MIGKKYNKDIFDRYENIITEQQMQNNELGNILNEISNSNLQPNSKNILSNLLKNQNVAQIFATITQQTPKAQSGLSDTELSKYLKKGQL
jgi:hypothetical protein